MKKNFPGEGAGALNQTGPEKLWSPDWPALTRRLDYLLSKGSLQPPPCADSGITLWEIYVPFSWQIKGTVYCTVPKN